MTFRIWRAASVLAIAATMSGCAFLQRQSLAQPEITVTEVRLAGAGTMGGTLDVILSIYNPNNFRIDGSNLHYRAFVDTIKVAEGSIDERITLLNKDRSEVHVPVAFGFREALEVLTLFSQRGSLPFQIEGDIKFETPVGSITRAFVQRGTYDGLKITIIAPKKK